MLEKFNTKYERGKSKKIKLLAVCIKSITGVFGSTCILTEQRPVLTLVILGVGAVSNEVLNFISSETDNQTKIP